MKLKRSPWFVF